MRLIGRLYYPDFDDGDPNKSYQVPIAITPAMVVITLLGTVISQLIFRYLGDRMGRRRVYGLALMCMVLSSIGCGFSIYTSPTYVLVSLGFFRFLLGVGIRGDYPLSTTIMSEKELVERTGNSSILSVCDKEVACYKTATLIAAVVPDFCFLPQQQLWMSTLLAYTNEDITEKLRSWTKEILVHHQTSIDAASNDDGDNDRYDTSRENVDSSAKVEEEPKCHEVAHNSGHSSNKESNGAMVKRESEVVVVAQA